VRLALLLPHLAGLLPRGSLPHIWQEPQLQQHRRLISQGRRQQQQQQQRQQQRQQQQQQQRQRQQQQELSHDSEDEAPMEADRQEGEAAGAAAPAAANARAGAAARGSSKRGCPLQQADELAAGAVEQGGREAKRRAAGEVAAAAAGPPPPRHQRMQAVRLIRGAGRPGPGPLGSGGSSSKEDAAAALAGGQGEQAAKLRYKWFCSRCLDSAGGCTRCSERRAQQDFGAWLAAHPPPAFRCKYCQDLRPLGCSRCARKVAQQQLAGEGQG
jgi:hypothetical protein